MRVILRFLGQVHSKFHLKSILKFWSRLHCCIQKCQFLLLPGCISIIYLNCAQKPEDESVSDSFACISWLRTGHLSGNYQVFSQMEEWCLKEVMSLWGSWSRPFRILQRYCLRWHSRRLEPCKNDSKDMVLHLNSLKSTYLLVRSVLVE